MIKFLLLFFIIIIIVFSVLYIGFWKSFLLIVFTAIIIFLIKFLLRKLISTNDGN